MISVGGGTHCIVHLHTLQHLHALPPLPHRHPCLHPPPHPQPAPLHTPYPRKHALHHLRQQEPVPPVLHALVNLLKHAPRQHIEPVPVGAQIHAAQRIQAPPQPAVAVQNVAQPRRHAVVPRADPRLERRGERVLERRERVAAAAVDGHGELCVLRGVGGVCGEHGGRQVVVGEALQEHDALAGDEDACCGGVDEAGRLQGARGGVGAEGELVVPEPAGLDLVGREGLRDEEDLGGAELSALHPGADGTEVGLQAGEEEGGHEGEGCVVAGGLEGAGGGEEVLEVEGGEGGLRDGRGGGVGYGLYYV